MTMAPDLTFLHSGLCPHTKGLLDLASQHRFTHGQQPCSLLHLWAPHGDIC